MNRFKESYKGFPDGYLMKNEAPDFILTKPDGSTIGIELTEALHNEQARRVSSETYNFTNSVLDELKNYLPFTFTIDIDLDISRPISKANRPKIVTEVVEQCIKEFRNLAPLESKEIEHIEMNFSEIPKDRPDILNILLERGCRNLPEGVQRITITRIDGIEDSWNWQGEGGVVPDLTIETIAPILEKKHQKLKNYTNCHQFWLIITEGNYYTGSFNEIGINIPIESSFDKVFLLRSNKGFVLELK